eukprot:TRINITY_DN9117_c0_g1_i1.p1 TRINITY_DN9117_c0_g1~~TRINITY_DN9117_c0_g1_i1.p1  ORF type:complete len:206 (+),score=24.03 TRINITY_DN9117_c0_g1_i1:27-620(+)
MSTAVVPGMRLGSISEYASGEGTYVSGNDVFASVAGFKHVTEPEQIATESTKPQARPKAIVSVERPQQKPNIVPAMNSVVLAQITKVTPRFAHASILCVGDKPLSEQYTGTIKSTDVRAAQTDSVEMYKCFRPGDIVRAEVISLGDARSYYLSTAKNEYGVIFAKSVSGVTMVPISWNLMQCPKTKIKEFRKVAKTM